MFDEKETVLGDGLECFDVIEYGASVKVSSSCSAFYQPILIPLVGLGLILHGLILCLTILRQKNDALMLMLVGDILCLGNQKSH